jgi:uncharacterized protein (TIGR03083 family)
MTNEHDDRLGAWALDALEPDERLIVDRDLAGDPARRAEADRLRQVVALLGDDHAAPPPADVRERVLEKARTTAQRGVTSSDPIAVYRHQTDALSALLDAIVDGEWQRRVAPYDWDIHGVVAHLLVIERYMGRQLGIVDGEPSPDDDDHLGIGRATIRAELARPPHDTVADWRAAVAHNLTALGGAAGVELDRTVVFHVFPFTVSALLVARGFEVWTHADDIRRAVARPLDAPSASDLRTMSTVSVASLPLALHAVPGATIPDGSARVVLTGAGGGTFDIVLGRGGDRLLTLVADVVDYCRCAARRIAPGELAATIDGDGRLAADLLAAAAVAAV